MAGKCSWRNTKNLRVFQAFPSTDRPIDHPLISKSDKLVLNMFSSNSTPFNEVTSKEEMLLVAQLLILSEVGGIVLPVSSLVINSLQPLLYYEAVRVGRVTW